MAKVAVIVGLGVFFWVTCPNFTDHKAKIAWTVQASHGIFGEFAAVLAPWDDLEFIDILGLSLTQSKSRNTWVSIGGIGEVKVLDEDWGRMQLSRSSSQ